MTPSLPPARRGPSAQGRRGPGPLWRPFFPTRRRRRQGAVRTGAAALDGRLLHRARRRDPDAAVFALRVNEALDHIMIKVAKLKHLGEYRVRATFSDGMAGEYDFAAIVT